MIKALIIDDEQDNRSVLKLLLSKFGADIQVLGEASNINRGYELILDRKPQVIFLDVQMPGGSGFDLLKKFTHIDFEVIFVTSYDQYAIDAIKFSALDYLLKPIEIDDLKFSLQKLSKRIQEKRTSQLQFVNVIDHIENRPIEKKIILHHHDQVILLPLNQIVLLSGERNYTVIQTINKEKYTSSKNLAEFEEMLESHPMFFRISKSYLVNLNHVTGYTKGEPCIINIDGGFEIEVSRRKKQEFLDRFKKAQ